MRLCIVGEAPGRRTGPVPFAGRTGGVLAGLLGVPRDGWEAAGIGAVNLFRRWPGALGRGSAFPGPRSARARASLVLASIPNDVPAVLCGLRVARAVGLRRARWFEWVDLDDLQVAVVPHPSGVSHWWNSPANRRAAREFFSGLLPAPA
jgi:uracil-DNA glycosylase